MSCWRTPAAASSFWSRKTSITVGEVGARTSLRLLDRPGQVEIVGASFSDGDPHALPVDILDRPQGRVRRDKVGSLDHDIRRGECDVVGTPGIDGQERDVPHAGLDRIRDLPGCLEQDELDRNAEPAGELAGEIDRNPPRLAGRRVLLSQNGITKVDGCPQLAFRRNLLDHLRRDGLRRGMTSEQDDRQGLQKPQHDCLASEFQSSQASHVAHPDGPERSWWCSQSLPHSLLRGTP